MPPSRIPVGVRSKFVKISAASLRTHVITDASDQAKGKPGEGMVDQNGHQIRRGVCYKILLRPNTQVASARAHPLDNKIGECIGAITIGAAGERFLVLRSASDTIYVGPATKVIATSCRAGGARRTRRRSRKSLRQRQRKSRRSTKKRD